MKVGIDLGTTYSAVAYVDDSGRAEVLQNGEGNTITPSVVLFDSNEEIIVGDIAKENAVMRPEDVVSVVKNNMGKKCIAKVHGGVEYSPEMISSFILRKLVKDAENVLGEKITGAVITVPAYFTESQRKATKDAALLAELPFLGMINEPTAAALCYAKKHKIENENIMVYDLGGGTFDVTVLHVENEDKIEVLSTGGLSNAGGRFFDQYIVDYVCDYFSDKYNLDLQDEDHVDDLQDLYLKAENAKQQLSSRKTVKINMKIGNIKEQIELSREQFDLMIKKVYMRTESKMKEALKEAGIQEDAVDKVLLVGGSSRIPYIYDNIKAFVNKEPSKELNPDEAVAMGAAIYAKMKADEKVEERLFVDVCSHGIGVVVINDKGMEENEVIIRRNSKLPLECERRFRTAVSNQKKIDLTLTEGEYKELTDVTEIGSFDIVLPEGIEKNALILLKISLDLYQMIHVRLEIPDASFAKECHIKRIANMDDDTIANVTGMLRDYAIS